MTNGESYIISILCGNHCENFILYIYVYRGQRADVPRAIKEITCRASFSRGKPGARKFRDPFWYSRDGIYYGRSTRNRFPAPQVKFETLRHPFPASSSSLVVSFLREKIFAKRVTALSSPRCSRRSIFMWHWKSDIMSHCRNVSRSRKFSSTFFFFFCWILYYMFFVWYLCVRAALIYIHATKITIHSAVVWWNITLPIIKNFFHIIVCVCVCCANYKRTTLFSR